MRQRTLRARTSCAELQYPAQLDLGHFPGLQSGLTGSLIVTNPGLIAADSVQIVPEVAGDPTEFTVDASGCPADLGPGQSCKVSIGLTPKTLGLKQATLTAKADDVTPSATCPVTATFGQLIAIDLVVPNYGLATLPPLSIRTRVRSAQFDANNHAYFTNGTSVSISIDNLPPGYGVTWGPPCTSTSGLCTFTVTADEQVTATIEPPLVVDITQTVPAGSRSGGNNYGGVGSIDVASAGQTQSCIQDRCGFDLLGAVTLTPYYQVYGSPPWGVVVEQWGGPCVGAGASCALNVTSSTGSERGALSSQSGVHNWAVSALPRFWPMGLVPTLRATQRLAPTAIRSPMSRGLPPAPAIQPTCWRLEPGGTWDPGVSHGTSQRVTLPTSPGRASSCRFKLEGTCPS